MKKLALALVCLVSVAFFASCTEPVENPEPSIEVVTTEGFVQDGAVIDVLGDTTFVTFGFNVASNPDTKKMLSSLVVSVDDEQLANLSLSNQSNFTYSNVLAYTFSRDEIIGESTITAIVTDEAGETNTASITIKFNQVAMDLEVKDFSWLRQGTNPGEGLAEYGLEWKSNVKEAHAIIKPVEGATLYGFSADTWDEVVTDADKLNAFTEGLHTIMDDFRGVSAWNSHDDYDFVIGTLYNNEYHLIHITKGDVQSITNDQGQYIRTDITITGQSK